MTQFDLVLRPAHEADMELINTYAAWEGMDAIPSPEGVTVAVNEDDLPVAFVRVWVDEQEKQANANQNSGQAYVNPIVVYAPWRRFGVGRMLMDDVHARFESVRLVARGMSVPFYEALGYKPVSWDDLAAEITGDCDGCEMYEECKPQPMQWHR